MSFKFEPAKLPYVIHHTYLPDFLLLNGIYIEAKGKLDTQTKVKMRAIKKQHPDLDIRFVFMNASNKLTKHSKMTYGDWADKEGYLWADGKIPEEWLK